MAADFDHEAFEDEVLRHVAGMLEVEDARSGTPRSREVFGPPPVEGAVPGMTPEQVDAMVAEATEKVVQQPGVMARLCPALRSGGDSVWEIAKVITPPLIP